MEDRGQMAKVSIVDTLTELVTSIRKQIVKRHVVHLSGATSIATASDELIVVCLVRNGEPWIRSFLDHYFKLGAVLTAGYNHRTIIPTRSQQVSAFADGGKS